MVAHSLAVIVRQADAGRYAARSNPATAGQVLATIAGTGRDALTDMRSLLGVLRRGGTCADPDEGTSPQPTLDDVAVVDDRMHSSGLAVALHEHGAPVPLDRTGELAAYRLVQEALTNVVKHAGADARAEVHLGWDKDGLTVTVTDTGGGARQAAGENHGGQGLVGMRERLHLAGGDLVAGPQVGDGFFVRGRVPARGRPVVEGAA